MGKAKTIYSELAVAREPAMITCILAETRRQVGEWEGFIVEGKGREGFRSILTGGCCWHGEAAGG